MGKTEVILTKHALQRLQERYDSSVDETAANSVAWNALKKGKTFAQFIRVDESTDRKVLSGIFRHLTPGRFAMMYNKRAFIFQRSGKQGRYTLVTVLNLEGEESYEEKAR